MSAETKSGVPVAARRRWRRVGYRIAALGLAVIVTCTMEEAALRIVDYRPKYTSPFGTFHELDSFLGWHGKRDFTAQVEGDSFNVVIANDQNGFRRVEHQRGTAAGQRNVFVLGDSFVWGWGVGQGQVVTDELERLLPGCRVHNFGLAAAGTLHEYMIFAKYVAPQLHPKDVVVLAFYGNDFGDNTGYNHSGRLHAIVEDGKVRLVPPDGTACPSKVVAILRDNSYLFNFLAYSAEKLRMIIQRWNENGTATSVNLARSLNTKAC